MYVGSEVHCLTRIAIEMNKASAEVSLGEKFALKQATKMFERFCSPNHDGAVGNEQVNYETSF